MQLNACACRTCPNKHGYPGASAMAPTVTQNVANPTVVSTAGR